MMIWLFACWAPVESDTVRSPPGHGEERSASDSGPLDTGTPETGHRADTADSEDTTPAAEPAVAILSPADGATVSNPVRFRLSVANVARAELDADGYALGTVETTGESSLEYSFSGTGYTRAVTLTGYDDEGTAVATASVSIMVEPDEVSIDVPYFYQYDNTYEPGSTCGITSAAMLVDTFHPDSVTPDTLYLRYGKSAGQSPSTLAALYEDEGLHADWTTTGTRAQIRAHLDAGRPVVAHGYWTGSGHVVVIVGYSDTDWIVNDPAGDWYTCYGCGEADHVHYPLGGSWDDAMSVDGDLWFSTADETAF
jgi:hypothetical protein